MIYVTHDQTEAMTLGHRIAVLNLGRLQQVAPPQELYDRPANAFVAGFIGNPPMNVFPVRVQGADGSAVQLARRGSGAGHSGPPARAGAGDRLSAGVRPEAFALSAGGAAAAALSATVEHVEFLGHETLAHVQVGTGADGVRLVVRLPGMQRLAKDDRVRLAIDPERLHLFDEHGQALRR